MDLLPNKTQDKINKKDPLHNDSSSSRLWILRPVVNLPIDDNPWWYTKSFGFIIRAVNEIEARKLAHDCAERRNYNKFISPWLNAKYSACIELSQNGKHEIIMENFYNT